MVMDNPAGNARFYRLISPFGTNLPPTLPPRVTFLGNGDLLFEEPVSSDGTIQYSWTADVSATGTATLDASAMFDPACPTNNSLSFAWDIYADDQGDDLISPGIKGSATPVISFNSNTLFNDQYIFQLTVTSRYSGLTDVRYVDITIDSSSVFYPIGDYTDILSHPGPYTIAVQRYAANLFGYSDVFGFY
jgi:hypothetical protein